jgi:hypothetical protein
LIGLREQATDRVSTESAKMPMRMVVFIERLRDRGPDRYRGTFSGRLPRKAIVR